VTFLNRSAHIQKVYSLQPDFPVGLDGGALVVGEPVQRVVPAGPAQKPGRAGLAPDSRNVFAKP